MASPNFASDSYTTNEEEEMLRCHWLAAAGTCRFIARRGDYYYRICVVSGLKASKMYIPASREALVRGIEVKPHQKSLYDRLKELAEKHSLVNTELDGTSSNVIMPGQISDMFSEGDTRVWEYLPEFTLCCLTVDHPLREFCVTVMLNKWFDRVVLCSIIANALFLAADNPLDNNNQIVFFVAEVVFNSIFLAEFFVKIVALGANNFPAGYFQDHWNRLDMLVLVIGWLPVFLDISGLGEVANFSFIRAIRILKVLKTVNNVPGLKRLVKAVLDAIPRLISVGYLLTFIFLLFGILGTQLYMGQLRQRCFPRNVRDEYPGQNYEPSDALCAIDVKYGVQCPAHYKCSQRYPGTHNYNSNVNEFQNFDNSANAFLTIFVVISLEGWSDTMFNIMDTAGTPNAGYFVFLVFVGAYFVVNLVIAVIYQSYIDTIDQAQAKKDASTTAEATARHKKSRKEQTPSLICMLYDEYLAPEFLYEILTSDPTYTGVKRRLRAIVNSASFHWAIVVLIICNIVVLAIEANGVSGVMQDVANNANFIFTVCFVVELAARIVATDITKFFMVPFNVLDTAIVIVSVSEFFYHGASNALSAFRTLRVFRTFKLLNRWESLQQLVYAVFKSGPGLGYFCIILFLYIFICALAGRSLFAGKLTGEEFTYGDQRTNYDSLFISLVTTFQVVSGENWNDVMFRAMEFNETLGGIYFVVVYGIGNLIVLNLFLAILLENFSEGRYREDKISYYEQLDHQRDVQIVVGTVWGTFTALLKRKVWVASGYTLCRRLIPHSWAGAVVSSSDQSSSVSDVVSLDDEYGIVEMQVQGERVSDGGAEESGSVWQKTVNFVRGRRHGSVSSTGSHRSSVADPDDECYGKQVSKWEGWDAEEDPYSPQAMDLLKNDATRRLILGDIVLGQYRRGNQYFNDCFMALEVVDILLDRGIASSVEEAIRVGQELVSRRKLLPVYLHRTDTEVDGDEEFSVMTPRSMESSSQHIASEVRLNIIGSRKISANVETRFADDRTLYRLSDQGEQVTEWLMTSKVAEQSMIEHKAQKKLDDMNDMLQDEAFCLFDADSPLRKFCAQAVLHKYFELFVVAMIISSSVFLALDEPHVESTSQLGRALLLSDYFFTIFFICEMLVKMMAMGVCYTPRAYFKNEWNILDFVIVCVSTLSLSLRSLDLSFLKAFRALRAMRPLRMVSRSPGMRAVVNAIIMVVPPLMNFVLVISVFLFTFAILGTSMYRGHLAYCHATGDWDPSLNADYVDEFRYTLNAGECTGTVINSDGYECNLHWKSVDSNFDNIGSALLTLFELSTMENWPGIMHPAMDIVTRKYDHPIENNSQYNALFFIAFIIVGAFFITNLFVGIIVHKFNKARQMDKASVFLSDDQHQWLSDLKVAMSARPHKQAAVPSETDMFGMKRPIYYLVQNYHFHLLMDFFILLNIFVMMLTHFNQPRALTRIIYVTDIIFAVIFAIELLLRYLAVPLKDFVKNNWNRFDFLIVLGALLDVSGLSLVFNVTIFRVLRIGRILRLVKSSKNLLVLIKTLLFSLPSLLNVGSLLFLAFFVFTVVGMNLFGNVERDGVWFTEYNNFEHFGATMLLLFRCMTGENWNSIMHYMQDSGFPLAVPYFALFLICCRYMMLNLFIAVILENFEAALAADPDKVQHNNLEDFIEAWANIHDELGAEDKDRLPCYALVKLIHSLKPPLGIKNLPETELGLGDNSQRQLHRNFVLSFVRSLDLKEDSKGRVYFVDVISALVRRSGSKYKDGRNVLATMSTDQKHELLYRMRKMTKNKTIKKLEAKMKDEVFTEVDLAVEFNSAMTMQAMWRGKQSREKLRRIIAEMMRQNRRSSYGESRKQSRKSIRDMLRLSSRRSFRSNSDLSQSPDDSTAGERSGADDQSVLSFIFNKKKSRKTGGSASNSRAGSRSPVEPDDRSGTAKYDDGDDDSGHPPVQQLEIRPTSLKSMDTETSEVGEMGVKQSSWLAPLRGGFKRPSSFRREDSAVSGITQSSWESAVDRHLRKQQSMESVATITEDKPMEDGDVASGSAWRRPSSLFAWRQDSSTQWPVHEVTSSRNLVETLKKDVSAGDDRQLRRSRTFNTSMPVSLAELTGLRPFKTASSGASEEDTSLDVDGDEVNPRRSSFKRHTIATATDRSLFTPRSPRQRVEDIQRHRRKTIARMNSGDTSSHASQQSTPLSRKQQSSRSLQHTISDRSIDFVVDPVLLNISPSRDAPSVGVSQSERDDPTSAADSQASNAEASDASAAVSDMSALTGPSMVSRSPAVPQSTHELSKSL